MFDLKYLAIFVTSLLGFLCVFLYKWIRPKFSIKVNCWFCNKNTVVPYGNKDCWDCPFCEQYNGFDKDGDYNKPIPAQRLENLNFPVTVSNDKKYGNPEKFKNGLCHTCNRNQRIKIKQLAKFEPHFEETYDEEIADFSKHLDKVYSLCASCELILETKLKEESKAMNGMILDHQLNESSDKETVLSRSIYTSQLQTNTSCLLRVVASCLSILLFTCDINNLQEDCGTIILPIKSLLPTFFASYTKLVQGSALAPLIGLLCVVTAVFNSGKFRLQRTDGFTCLAWVLLLCLHNQLIYLLLPKQDVLLLCPLVSILVILLTLLSTVCRQFTFERNFGKILLSNRSRPSPVGKLRSLNNGYYDGLMDDTFTSVSQQTCVKCMSEMNRSTTSVQDESFLMRPKRNDINKLPSTFDAMKIDSANTQKKRGLFTNKIYDNSRVIPETSRSLCSLKTRKPSLIQPAKLELMNQFNHSKPFTRSSWVDGGFWDNHFIKASPFPQANSYESGFVGSVCEDRFSAKSEPLISMKSQNSIGSNHLDMANISACLSSSMIKRNEEKTSEYGSDSQLSHFSQRVSYR